uniref:Uncharacterized protein n=1 Tax=Tanacetum cinerariifolium TaxID=118510 RepID=A0A6L2P4Q7_TANCI|nr:hypothetical protein [Tanacetum cinerariifolium]
MGQIVSKGLMNSYMSILLLQVCMYGQDSDVVPTAGSRADRCSAWKRVGRELEEQMGREDQRTSEQIVRDAKIVRIHTEEELQIMIDGLDRSNETVAKYLQEYHQFATEFPLERRIELISDLVRYQDNYAKVHKFQIQQRKPWSKKQKRDYYMEVIKSNFSWKVKYFRGMTFEEIEAKFTTVWKQIKNFIPMGSMEEAKRFKRKGIRFKQETMKKLKTSKEVPKEVKRSDEVPEEKVKEMMQLVPIEEVYVEVLQVKHPIIDWKLWALVKESLNIRPASSDKEMELWVELKRLYEPDDEDQLWTHTQNLMHALVEWKLYDTCGVHHVTSKDKEIFMLVEKDYRLRKVIEFLLPDEVPTGSEESSHCQKKRDATDVNIALLLKSRRNCHERITRTRRLFNVSLGQHTRKICESNSNYGFECPQRVLLVYEPEPCYTQNFSDNNYSHDLPSVNLLIDHHRCYKCGNSLNNFFCHHCTCEFYGNGAHIGYNYPAQVPSFQTLPSFPQQYPCCEDCGGLPEADHCQPPQYTVNHPMFNAHNDLLNSRNKLMKQVTSMCEMFGQFIQKNHEEEQAANARYWKIPAYCDDDDYNFAITPNVPVDSLSMGDEHLNTISETESDEFIKSSIENLVPNPNLSKDIYLNPLFDEEIIPMKIDPHPFNAESDLMEYLDIPILEELLDNYSLSLPKNESFHFDIPSFSRPPAKPPDGDTGILNVKMMGDISEQQVPMPRFMITLVPNQVKSPDLLTHQGLEAFQPSAECLMIINGKNTPILDVPLFHLYPY